MKIQPSAVKRFLHFLAILGALCGHCSAAEKPAPRPNIIFLLADDLGYGDLGCCGHPRLKTPNLDRLASEGTRFTQFYVSHCVCSPTRASAITGQYPSRWNIYAHLAWLDENASRGMPDWLDAKAPSLPRAMQQAGYRTALFGKWHLGGGSGGVFRGRAINSPDAPPVESYGFDQVRIDSGNGPAWKGTQPVSQPHDTYPLEDAPWMTWSSRVLADTAIEFIDEHARTPGRPPFLLDIWFTAPHVPLLPTEAMRKAYEDVAAPPAERAYYAVVTHLDEQIGRILEKLDETGLREQTLVIFTSDNGAAVPFASPALGTVAARDTAGSNGPLRGWKWHLHEGGIRVPLIARWPGQIPAGRIDTTSVLNICDFTPTFTRLAGASMPEGYQPDGVDITAALRGQPFTRGQPMFWHHPTATRRGPVLAIRDGAWKLLMEADGTEIELYHLDRDVSETTNVAGANAEIAASLKAKLRAWQRSLPKPLERAVSR